LSRYIAKLVHRRVTCHTVRPDDQSIRGLLTGAYKDCLVLSHAEYLVSEGAPIKLDGDVVMPRERVAYLELHG
jgi:hypothetical protein